MRCAGSKRAFSRTCNNCYARKTKTNKKKKNKNKNKNETYRSLLQRIVLAPPLKLRQSNNLNVRINRQSNINTFKRFCSARAASRSRRRVSLRRAIRSAPTILPRLYRPASAKKSKLIFCFLFWQRKLTNGASWARTRSASPSSLALLPDENQTVF